MGYFGLRLKSEESPIILWAYFKFFILMYFDKFSIGLRVVMLSKLCFFVFPFDVIISHLKVCQKAAAALNLEASRLLKS